MGGYREIAAFSSVSSTSTAESSFREHDDVFLQTQTRIWLGEVLNIRLDEHLHISDLLADGDVLFEVSKVLWNMLLAKCGELRHLKYEPLGSRRSSGRYMPYSNVDSFLKICNILGLNGIDLFSPSDVVEKRNIRKVCICIRALSIKARSKQLKVPDFDIVTYTIVMPKDMVGGIRRSLETSHCSLSSSSGYNSYKDTRSRLRERNATAECEKNYDAFSEESDEAESKFIGEESYCSSMNQHEDEDAADLGLDNSLDKHSAVRNNSREKISTHDHDVYDCDFSKYESELAKSFPQCARNGSPQDSLANDRIHLNHSDLKEVNDESVVGDSMYGNEVGGSYISSYLAFSDSIIGGTDGNTPVLRNGEENIFNFFMDIDSHGPNSSERTFRNGNNFSDSEDAEVSSTTSMSSVLCRVRALDFDDGFDADGCVMAETPGALVENEADKQYKGSFASHGAWNAAENELMFRHLNIDSKESSMVTPKISASPGEVRYTCPDELQSAAREPLTDQIVSLSGNSSDSFVSNDDEEAIRNKDSYKEVSRHLAREPSTTFDGDHMDHSSVISANCCESVEEKHPCSRSSAYDSGDASNLSEPTPPRDNGDTKHNGTYVLEANASEASQDTDAGLAKHKGKQRPLLKTVARGTALVGVLFLLLQFSRRRNKEESSEANGKPSQNKKFRGRDFSYGDGKNGSGVARVYPSEKLKFKN